ncbi:fatty acid synthase alpha subunit Lsd1 [Coemansia sp. RSA 1721]|nr:fatty acid synthase alpha subunit Lsd1 [Coemansia sp. RSA 1721]
MAKLVLRRRHLYVELPIAFEHQRQGQLIADAFTSAIDDEVVSDTTETELKDSFMQFAASKHPDIAAAIDSKDVLRLSTADNPNVYDSIVDPGLKVTEAQANEMLRSFYSQQLVSEKLANPIVVPNELDATGLLAIFQGPVGFDNGGVVSLDEISHLVETYGALVAPFVAAMSEFLDQESRDLQVAHFYPSGFSVLAWIANSKKPTDAYLNSSPVTWPLVGFAQLVRYTALCKTRNMFPKQLLESIKALAGHSHGIAVAAAVAMAGNEEQLIDASKTALGTLLLAGCLPQMVSPQSPAIPTQQQQQPATTTCGGDDIGAPSSMLVVDGVSRYIAEHVLGKYNNYHRGNPSAKVYMAMSNTDTSFVASGNTSWLGQFAGIVQSKAAGSKDQDKVPFMQRKPRVALKYLSTEGAFHSPHMQSVAERHVEYAKKKGWVFDATKMLAAVCAPDGKCADIRALGEDLTLSVAEYMYTKPVEWPATVFSSAETSCVLDMTSGNNEFYQKSHLCVRRATWKVLLGCGVCVVCADRVTPMDDPVLRPCSVLYSSAALAASSGAAASWKQQYGARLSISKAVPKLLVSTRIRRLFRGLPPVFVGGMFPTTADIDFVAASAKAGFFAELDIGHVSTKHQLQKDIMELASKLPAGHPIALSGVCVADVTKWQWQLDAILELRTTQRLCISGLGIRDGIIPQPSDLGFVSQLQKAGLDYVALRPMTEAQVHQALVIAAQNPGFAVMLQWMGGRSGGKHSYDEFHTSIIATYAEVRRHNNVFLVAGAGVGDAQGAESFLSGSWALDCGAHAYMPFDAVMLRSRLIAARESKVRCEIKQLAVQASGLDAGDIASLHNESMDAGVVSILDHESSPLHVLDTRAARLCLELSTSVFSQPRNKQLGILLARKQEIVLRLNSEYMRPWFAQTHEHGSIKPDGAVVELEDMTYAEVIDRLLELVYNRETNRWAHSSLRVLVAKFAYHTAQRLKASEISAPVSIPVTVAHDIVLDEIACFKLNYPLIHTQLLAADDVDYFLQLCKCPEKTAPVPFVPVINDDFAWYMMHRCFDQCRDGDGFVQCDMQQMLVPVGPVAAAFITEMNEPVSHILEGVVNGVVEHILQAEYSGDRSLVPEEAICGNTPMASLSKDPWFISLINDHRHCWLGVVLTAPFIVQGTQQTNNFIARLLQEHHEDTSISIDTPADSQYPLSLAIVNNASQATELLLSYTPGTHTVHLQIPHQGKCLHLEYLVSESTPWAPVHEIVDKRDHQLRSFFQEDTEPCGFEITLASVAAFCRSNSIELPGYPPNTDDATCVPVDYLWAMVAQPRAFAALAANKSICHGGLLGAQLVTVDVELMPKGTPMTYTLAQVEDVIRSNARVTESLLTKTGTTQAVVLVDCFNDEQQLATITFTYEFAQPPVNGKPFVGFRHCDEPEYLITMRSADDVAVLESKPWFRYNGQHRPKLVTGDRLYFNLQSSYKLRTDGLFACAETTGPVYLRKGVHERELIGQVSYHDTNTQGNPVIGYLRKMVDDADPDYANPIKPVDIPEHCPLAGGEYPVTQQPITLVAPLTLDGLGLSTDNRYLALMTAQTTIPLHWCSAMVRALIEQHVAESCPERVIRYTSEFLHGVYPGDHIQVQLDHVAMCDGNLVIRGHASVNSVSVFRCMAIVAAPPTMYVFTGQGSQEQNMGMDLYKRSKVAQQIYDRVENHMRESFGFSLLHIIKDNPSECTVYFGGQQGTKIRNHYMQFRSRRTDPKTGHTVEVPLFPEITSTSLSYTYRSPQGLLHCTQFAQPAIMAFDIAMLADMRAHGLVQTNSVLGGHSLGEYGALAAFGIMTPEDITEITFIRGMTMQSTVSRDSDHRSEFAMVAANPARVSNGFTETSLALVIDAICSKHSDKLLEIVNYNVRGYQYVVAGSRPMLQVLADTLDFLHAGKYNFAAQGWIKHTRKFIEETELPALDTCKELQKSRATIPIPGIDVPFHSSHLLPGADLFRQSIIRMIRQTDVDNASLQGRYIPNLNAQFYQVTRTYFEQVHRQTGSPVIAHEIARWPEDDEFSSVERLRLARLLMIELLAYQFASPVRWIETQERVFNEIGVRRVVEVGPNATLCRMAKATLKMAAMDTQVQVLHMPCDEDILYYRTARLAADQAQEKIRSALPEPDVVPALPQPETAPALPQTAPVPASVPDVQLFPLDVLRTIVAQKLRRPLSQISDTSSLRELTGGKSTLLNEILGDVLKEFSLSSTQSIPDHIDELSLSDICHSLSLDQPLTGLGKYTEMQIARLFSSKMPGSLSVSVARRWFQATYGLERGHQQDAVLLVALTMEPENRLESIEAAYGWLATAVEAYANTKGIKLPAIGQLDQNNQPGSAAAATINSAEFDQLQGKLRRVAEQQMAIYSEYLDHSQAPVASPGHSEEAHKLDNISAELGAEFLDGIQPMFDTHKIRRFDSHWNWARQDAVTWITSVQISNEPVNWTAQDNKQRLLQLQNRTDPQLVSLLDALAKQNTGECARTLACTLRDRCTDALNHPPVYRELCSTSQPVTRIDSTGKLSYTEQSPRHNEPTMCDYVDLISSEPAAATGYTPLVHLRQCSETHAWEYSAQISHPFYTCLRSQLTSGVSYHGTTALITGCSHGSIAWHMLQSLLSGGCFVIATTSSYKKSVKQYESLYREHGARGSQLLVVPYNQASWQDTRGLVGYIYQTLGRNLDYVLPFAATSDYNCDITNLGAHAELSLRVQLTNVLRMLGEIKLTKEKKRWEGRPTLAVLPMSSNHGELGFDGLYGESKAALETVFNRWRSENWTSLVSVAGAIIGWTRGTSLMAQNNLAAQLIEQRSNGGRTFSQSEMAFNLMGLLHPEMVRYAQLEPLWADLNGGLQRIKNVAETMTEIRKQLAAESSKRRKVAMSYLGDFATAVGHDVMPKQHDIEPLANHRHWFAQPPEHKDIKPLHQKLSGMANLDRVVVVTGFAEVGPFGGADTRWEMESFGEFSLEGCIELAWVMGLIKHAPEGQCGWIDASTGESIRDLDIKSRYEPHILQHTGIRPLEPSLMWDVKSPEFIPVMRELQIQHDLEPFEATHDEARQFKQHNNANVDIWRNKDSSWSVRFRKGAVLMIPKALRFDRLVGAQLPSGWSPQHYGIPEDVVSQVDPVTCYALVATSDALVRAGIVDPYELYTYFHPSHVGTTLGSGAGGVHMIRDLYRNRLMDKPVQSDILQETFANTMAAWINMLLLSSSGPIKPPIGGCATALLSIDVACDTIRQGAARVMVAGAVEGCVDQGSYEFAQMGATCSSVQETLAGRTPKEMMRPGTSTRSGFVESQGAGVVVLMSAAAALEFGAPIYAVIGYTGSATDKQGYSLPAPGIGLLSSTCETSKDCSSSNSNSNKLLDIDYRRKHLQMELAQIDQWEQQTMLIESPEDPETVRAQAKRRRQAAKDTWGVDFWRNQSLVSPLRGALAAWGLSADDLTLASLHATATFANDLNEATVLDAQLRSLGRTPGLAIPAVCQKHLTGHPKGPAAAWMLNSAIQSLHTGLIPGNHNADNIGVELRREFIYYPSETLQTPMVKSALLKSYGFGQVGAEMLVVHPRYLFACLEEAQLVGYKEKCLEREKRAYRYWQNVMKDKHKLVRIKDRPPYSVDQEQGVLTDPMARAKHDAATDTYYF